MTCSDPLALQRFIDGELESLEAEVLVDHLDTCEACRNEGHAAAALRAYVQERLGAEDEGEEESMAESVANIAGRLVLPPPDVRQHKRWWNRAWLAAAAALVLAVLVPVSFLSNLIASPGELLEEAAERNRMWMYQSNKILQWEVDTVSRGIKSTQDGRWRTYFWRRNDATSFAEVSRQVNPQGRIEFAQWTRTDGSTVRYRDRSGIIEVTPSTRAIREALPGLPAELRAPLERVLTHRTVAQSLDVNRRRDQERLHGRAIWIDGKARFSRVLDRIGRVYRITVDQNDRLRPDIIRAVHEYDFDSDTLRLLRLKTTIRYDDGTIGVHDSRWIGYREITPAEFAAQNPDKMLSSGIPVVQLTPRDLAEGALRK